MWAEQEREVFVSSLNIPARLEDMKKLTQGLLTNEVLSCWNGPKAEQTLY